MESGRGDTQGSGSGGGDGDDWQQGSQGSESGGGDDWQPGSQDSGSGGGDDWQQGSQDSGSGGGEGDDWQQGFLGSGSAGGDSDSQQGSQGSGSDDDSQQGSQGSQDLKRKWRDVEAAMKAMKDAFVKKNAEKSAKIRRLMQQNIELEQNLRNVENSSVQPVPTNNVELVPTVEEKTETTISQFKNVIPLVCSHLDMKDINNCRLACRKWNQDVCTLLENWHSPNLPSGSSSTSSKVPSEPLILLPWRFRYAYELYNDEKIQRFLKKMANHLGNPFLGRYLRVHWCGKSGTCFWESILALVEKYGKHIWNLDVVVHQDWETEKSFYNSLQKTLIHLPNLKYLSVDCSFKGPRPQSRTAVVLQILRTPLPPLPNLQSLRLFFSYEARLIRAFSPLFTKQIYRLELLDETLGNVYFKDEYLRELVNLEHLTVELKCEEENDIWRLLKFPCRNLKKLRFPCSNGSRPEVLFTSEEFGSLFEKFPRLEHLDLGYYQVEFDPSSAFRFSTLKTLKIAVDVEDDRDRQQNLDFLLWFPSLKQLCIRAQFWRNDTIIGPILDKMDKRSVVKLWACLFNGKTVDSNIWTLIPSLKSLVVGDDDVPSYEEDLTMRRVLPM